MKKDDPLGGIEITVALEDTIYKRGGPKRYAKKKTGINFLFSAMKEIQLELSLSNLAKIKTEQKLVSFFLSP